VNGKSYIGSSIELSKRFREYFNINRLIRNNMVISKALLKYGYSEFSLEILEYCKPSEAIAREQYYFDLLKPEYNILTTAGSTLGYKHSKETKAKIKGKIGRTYSLTVEQKERLKNRTYALERLNGLNSYTSSKSKKVEVEDTLNNEKTIYASFRKAAEAIGCTHMTVQRNIAKEGVTTLIKERYIVKLVKGEDLNIISPSKVEIVEVLDILNNVTSNYTSISEVARVIGCNRTTIYNVLNDERKKGVHRLIDNRYKVVRRQLNNG
jgi:group I intron endonuclease